MGQKKASEQENRLNLELWTRGGVGLTESLHESVNPNTTSTFALMDREEMKTQPLARRPSGSADPLQGDNGKLWENYKRKITSPECVSCCSRSITPPKQ